MSLPLESDSDALPFATKLHTRCPLLRTDRTLFCFVLHECNACSPWHQTNLAEALEALEYGGKVLDIVAIGYIAHEEDLVRW